MLILQCCSNSGSLGHSSWLQIDLIPVCFILRILAPFHLSLLSDLFSEVPLLLLIHLSSLSAPPLHMFSLC
jgi:hypothetical protein